MQEENKEKNKRFDFTFGIIIAAVIGFLLNLLANIYYDIFIVNSLKWENIDQTQFVGILLALIGMFGFLQFFIDDYRNEFKINKSFLKRFKDYFFYQYMPGRWLRIITGIYLGLILFAILVGLYYLMATFTGYIVATLVFLAAFYKIYRKEKLKSKDK